MARRRTRTTAQKLKNPNWRASLPTSALTPDQQRRRAENARMKAIDSSFASGPGYGRETRRGINAQLDMLYRPQLEEIDRQSKATETSTAAVQDKTRAAYDALSKFAQGLGGSTQGATADYLTKMSGATRLQGVEGVRDAGARGLAAVTELDAKRTSLAGERAARRQALLSEAITKDRDFNLTQQGILGRADAEKARVKAEADYRNRSLTVQERIAAARNNTTLTAAETRAEAAASAAASRLNKYGYTTAGWNRMSEAEKDKIRRGNGGGKPGTPRVEPESSLTPRRVIKEQTIRLGDLMKQWNFKPQELSGQGNRRRAEFISRLSKHSPNRLQGTNRLLTSASIDLIVNGRISKRNLKELRDAGIFITKEGKYWGGGNRGS